MFFVNSLRGCFKSGRFKTNRQVVKSKHTDLLHASIDMLMVCAAASVSLIVAVCSVDVSREKVTSCLNSSNKFRQGEMSYD